MRYIVYGAGAIGSVLGADLQRSGRDVVFIGRGAQLEAMQKSGLTIQTPEETFQVDVEAVGHPREIEFQPDDVVLLTMKTQDTEAALGDLQAAGGSRLPVVCAQNGVENERIAARRFAQVYAMVVWMPVTLESPGVVSHHAAPVHGILDSGRYPTGSDALIEAVMSDIREAGYCADANPTLMRSKYAKLLANLHTGLLGVCGVEGADASYTKRMRAEADACYEAAGIDAASAEEEEARRVACNFGGARIEGNNPLLGSVYQSLMRGVGTIETDFIHGEIVLMGAMHGVATPYCRALQWAAKEMANRKQQPGAYTVADLEQIARDEYGAA